MKNKNLVSNICSIVVGALVYVFMACAHAVLDLGVGVSFSVAGYDLLTGGTPALVGIGGYILLIGAAVLIVAGILGLLADLKVVKNKTFAKVVAIISFIVSLVVAVASILLVVGIATEGVGLGWAAIVNMAITIIAAVVAVIGVVTCKKSKK